MDERDAGEFLRKTDVDINQSALDNDDEKSRDGELVERDEKFDGENVDRCDVGDRRGNVEPMKYDVKLDECVEPNERDLCELRVHELNNLGDGLAFGELNDGRKFRRVGTSDLQIPSARADVLIDQTGSR